MSRPSAILIAGPTASGKSALALALAERLGGTIVNADSMQVYRDLHILTARPSAEDEARVPHLLYGHIDAADSYSAGRYAGDAAQAYNAVCAEGRLPLFVGGTGLYFQVLLEGLSPVPSIPDQVRTKWRALALSQPATELHGVLADTDPDMAARLAPTDAQRVVRALEVFEATGRSLADWQTRAGTPIVAGGNLVKLVLAPPREALHAGANARFQSMWDTGAIAEVRKLTARGLDPGLPAMRALGVSEISAFLAGKIAPELAIESGQTATRRYIKRQTTWLRKNMMSWHWLSAQQMERNLEESLMFIDR